MSGFIDDAIARAGLGAVLPARRGGDLEAARAALRAAGPVDLLVLGALADAVRTDECGPVVRIWSEPDRTVTWAAAYESELDLLRAVAIARVTGPTRARIGVDWGAIGLELAQVALGFGATDLAGPITRKSGALIRPEDLRKVKGQGMVASAALKWREIVRLVESAGRVAELPGELENVAREHAHA